ncbi:DinB family protein [Polaromonas sp. YR568]|uniref:DinB family protein n=1 Tax=Polaromonas sp. YR568 TaxID=1855301 RepID=UPI00398BF7D2
MTREFCDNYRLMARYNRWINERLYEACEALTDEARKQERGAFFGSIHRTLGHLLVADQVWLRRFAQCGVENAIAFASLGPDVLDMPEAYTLDMVLFQDWAGLKAKRAQLDAAIEQWVADMPDAYPQLTMRYANSKGVQREHAAWKAITHFFNHQTHHRGQASTLITQAGGTVGVTDLIALL